MQKPITLIPNRFGGYVLATDSGPDEASEYSATEARQLGRDGLARRVKQGSHVRLLSGRLARLVEKPQWKSTDSNNLGSARMDVWQVDGEWGGTYDVPLSRVAEVIS